MPNPINQKIHPCEDNDVLNIFRKCAADEKFFQKTLTEGWWNEPEKVKKAVASSRKFAARPLKKHHESD